MAAVQFCKDESMKNQILSPKHTSVSKPVAVATHERLLKKQRVTLIDALDRVIDKGAYVDGEVTLRIADVDLIFIGLRLLITSVSHAERLRGGTRMGKAESSHQDEVDIQKLEEQLRAVENKIPTIIDAQQPEEAVQGIAKLVLTLVELIRQLLEREAMRRIDGGTLTKREINKLGLTFTLLKKKVNQFKDIFGITEELNMDLGPLGNLL